MTDTEKSVSLDGEQYEGTARDRVYLAVLDVFESGTREVRTTELVEATGVSRQTVLAVLNALESEGWVTRPKPKSSIWTPGRLAKLQ